MTLKLVHNNGCKGEVVEKALDFGPLNLVVKKCGSCGVKTRAWVDKKTGKEVYGES